MNRQEMTQAIPPKYTEFLGGQLRDILNYQAEDNVDEDDLINQLLDEGLKVLAGKLQEHHRIFARLAPLPEDTERLK